MHNRFGKHIHKTCTFVVVDVQIVRRGEYSYQRRKASCLALSVHAISEKEKREILPATLYDVLHNYKVFAKTCKLKKKYTLSYRYQKEYRQLPQVRQN